MTTIWRKGRRLFATSAILMLVTAVVHTAGNLVPPEMTPEENQVFSAMASLHEPLVMGMSPSIGDIYWGVVFIMAVTLGGLGLLNLVVCSTASDAALRIAAWVNVIWVAAFLSVSWRFHLLPPLISGVPTEIILGLFLIRRQASARP